MEIEDASAENQMINTILSQFGDKMVKVNADTIRMLIQDQQRRDQDREERRLKERAEDLERENAGGRPHRSVIKIHPQVKWPILEDSDLDPEEFYREFEHVCQMCADGQGMAPTESSQSCSSLSEDTVGRCTTTW